MYRRRVEQLAAPGESPVSQVKRGKGKKGTFRIWLGRAKGVVKGEGSLQSSRSLAEGLDQGDSATRDATAPNLA